MARSFRKHPMPNMGSEKQCKKFTSEIAVLWCAGCPTCGFTDVWDDEYIFYYAEQYNESGKDFLTTHFREVSNPWDMTKDGKYNCGREGLRSSKMNPRHTPRLVIHDVENYWNPASNWRKQNLGRQLKGRANGF